jgi:type IV fimbrial biogenesis protein FimT
MVITRPAAARGFTLPELMAVVTIIALMSAMAAPSFSALVASQRAKGVASDLFTALTRTRSEAIKRNTEVTLKPATAGRWQDGWTIPNPADSGNIIDSHGPVPTITVIGPANVVYLANGRLKNAAAPSFQISAAEAPQVRCIGVDLSGRPFQKTSAC